MVNFYNVDCLTFMKSVPDKHYDLAIVDPPYGINVNMNAGRKKGEKKRYKEKKWDSTIPSDNYFKELKRVSKNQVIWGGNYFTQHLPPSMCWICWNKNVPEGVSFSGFELAWTSFNSAAKMADIPYSGFVGLDVKRIHPTEKPSKLYKWLLKKYAKQGDRIFDSHGGSCSIAIACHDYGFDLDICELDKDYFEAGKKRYENHVVQLKMF